MPYQFKTVGFERDEYYYDRNSFNSEISVPIAQGCESDFGVETADLLRWFRLDVESLPRLPQYFIRPRLRKTWRRDINARVSQYDVNGEVAVCKPVQWIPHATIIRSFPASYYESDTQLTTIESEKIFKRVQTHVECDGWKVETKSATRSYVTLEYYSSDVEKVIVKERHGTRARLVELVMGMTLEVEEVYTHRIHVLLGGKNWNDYLTWFGGPSWEDIRITNNSFNSVRQAQFRKVAIGDDHETPLWIQALPVLDSSKNVVGLELAFSCDGWSNWYAYLSGRPCKSTGREILAWHSWKPRVTYLATQGDLVWDSSSLITRPKSTENFVDIQRGYTETTPTTSQPNTSTSTQDTTTTESVSQPNTSTTTESVFDEKRWTGQDDIWEDDVVDREIVSRGPVRYQTSRPAQPAAPVMSGEYAFALAPVMQQMLVPQQPQFFQPQFVQPSVYPYANVPQGPVTTGARLLNGYDETTYSRGDRGRGEYIEESWTWEQKRSNPKSSWPWLFSGWARTNLNPATFDTIRFPFTTHHDTAPKVAIGLSALDISTEHNVRAYVTERHECDHVELSLGGWEGTRLHTATAEVMTFHGRDSQIQVGVHDTYGVDHSAKAVRVEFTTAFSQPPRVVAFLSKIDLSHRHEQKARVVVSHVDRAGFTLHIGDRSRAELHGYSIRYVAFPAHKLGICGEHGVAVAPKHRLQTSGFIHFPPGKFDRAPWVMLALSGVNFGRSRKVAVAVETTEVTREGFGWKLWGWDGAALRAAQISWVAQAGL